MWRLSKGGAYFSLSVKHCDAHWSAALLWGAAFTRVNTVNAEIIYESPKTI